MLTTLELRLVTRTINEKLRPAKAITNSQVKSYLMDDIIALELMNDIKGGDIECVKKLPGWEKINPKPTPEANLKLALWFIAKVGNAETALTAVRAAANALKSLDSGSQELPSLDFDNHKPEFDKRVITI